jgi:membrane protein implicated in regulation of membrane protease activity
MTGEPHWTPRPDPPTRFVSRFVAVWFAISAVAVLVWLIVPHSAVSVSLLALAILALLFGGLGVAMNRGHDLEKPPGRHERPTPS